MASITYVGSGSNIVWGTGGIESPSGCGVVISASNKYTGETLPVLNTVGVPDGLVIVPGMTEATIEAYTKSGSTPPDIGSIASINGVNVYIESVDTSYEQKGISKLRMSGKALPE